MLVSNLMDVKD